MTWPRIVRLPFGYLIRVRLASPAQVRKAAGSDSDAVWDDRTRTIWISRTLGARERRYVLTHELLHALTDYQHYVLGLEEGGGE